MTFVQTVRDNYMSSKSTDDKKILSPIQNVDLESCRKVHFDFKDKINYSNTVANYPYRHRTSASVNFSDSNTPTTPLIPKPLTINLLPPVFEESEKSPIKQKK